MAFYYIDIDGTATDDAGRETVKRTGVFEANLNNFPSVEAAFATTGVSPVAGDFFLGAHDSNGTPYSANATFSGPTNGDPLFIVSVDSQNQENALAGFSEGFSAINLSLTILGNVTTWGSSFAVRNDISPGSNAHFIVFNGLLSLDDAGDRVNMILDGACIELVDSILDFITPAGNSTTGIFMRANGNFSMTGGSVISSVTGTNANLCTGDAFNAGFTMSFDGVDLTSVITNLVANTGSSAATDNFKCVFKGCKLSATVAFFEEPITNFGGSILVLNSSDNATAAEHQFFYKDYRGTVEDNTTNLRLASIAFPDSGQKISLKIDTDSECSRLSPFIFDIPRAFVALSAAASDTLQFFITSNGTALTDADIWAEVHYPDGTTKNLWVGASGALQLTGSYTIDPLGTGTTLPTDASWDSSLTNEQTFKVDTSGVQGADSVPIVRIYVAVSTGANSIFLDPVFDAVAS